YKSNKLRTKYPCKEFSKGFVLFCLIHSLRFSSHFQRTNQGRSCHCRLLGSKGKTTQVNTYTSKGIIKAVQKCMTKGTVIHHRKENLYYTGKGNNDTPACSSPEHFKIFISVFGNIMFACFCGMLCYLIR